MLTLAQDAFVLKNLTLRQFICSSELLPSKINTRGSWFQGANILLTDKGDVKLGELLCSISILAGRLRVTYSEKCCLLLQLTSELRPK